MTILFSDSILPEGRHKGKLVGSLSMGILKAFQRSSSRYALSNEVMINLNKKEFPGSRSLGTDTEAIE